MRGDFIRDCVGWLALQTEWWSRADSTTEAEMMVRRNGSGGILPAVEGGILAARTKQWTFFRLSQLLKPLPTVQFFPPSWEARLYVRQDA
jgi:hypothetical protein